MLASCRVANTVVGAESSAAVSGAAPDTVPRGAEASGESFATKGEAGTVSMRSQKVFSMAERMARSTAHCFAGTTSTVTRKVTAHG